MRPTAALCAVWGTWLLLALVLAVPVSAWQTSFATDDFAGTLNTDLTSSTMESGGPWIKHGSNAGTIVLSGGGRAWHNSSGTDSLYYATTTPTSAEYDVQVDIVYVGTPLTDIRVGPAGRIQTGANTYYFARHEPAGPSWAIAYLSAGSLTDLAYSGTYALVSGHTYTLRLEIRDANKKLYVRDDGAAEVLQVTTADNTITLAGRAGIRGDDPLGNSTTTTGLNFDNFVATNPAAGGGSGPAAVLLHLMRGEL